MDLKSIKLMLLGILVMLGGGFLISISSGSAIVIPLVIMIGGFGIGLVGFLQK